jgi:hypothetical protein
MYKIIGADGRQYGPISAEQIREWIAEGRVESRTPVFINGAKDWTFLGLLPEFANAFPPHPPVIATPMRARKTNAFALAGLICGILSWVCCCGFPMNVLGLIFSLVALSQINRHPEINEGRGVAIAGLALSLVNLLLGLGMAAWSFAFNPPIVHWHTRGF